MVQTSQDKINDYYFYILITLWVLLAAFFFGRYGSTRNLQETLRPRFEGEVKGSKGEEGVIFGRIFFILILVGLLISILTFSVLLYLELNNTLV